MCGSATRFCQPPVGLVVGGERANIDTSNSAIFFSFVAAPMFSGLSLSSELKFLQEDKKAKYVRCALDLEVSTFAETDFPNDILCKSPNTVLKNRKALLYR
jgi:hypothetical protein